MPTRVKPKVPQKTKYSKQTRQVIQELKATAEEKERQRAEF